MDVQLKSFYLLECLNIFTFEGQIRQIAVVLIFRSEYLSIYPSIYLSVYTAHKQNIVLGHCLISNLDANIISIKLQFAISYQMLFIQIHTLTHRHNTHTHTHTHTLAYMYFVSDA